MTSFSHWDPTKDISSIRQMMDRFVNDPMFAGANWPHTPPRSSECGQNVAIDVIERESAYFISASIPGVKPDDLEIVLHDNVLTIQGECKCDSAAGLEDYHLHERMYGHFSRRIVFPSSVNATKVEAIYENGVLNLVLPKCGTMTPTRIEVQSSLNQNGHNSQVRVLSQPPANSQPAAISQPGMRRTMHN